MKKNYAAKLGALALVLTMMSTCLMGGTLARYVTEVTGTATATVAKWSFKANGETATIKAFDLASTAYDEITLAEKRIAPGTEGSFDIDLDGSGSEVGIDYTVKVAAETGITLPGDLTFQIINGTGDPQSYTLGNEITGTINHDTTANSMKKTITVKWAWDFGKDDTKDSNDNTYASNTWPLNITVMGKQVELKAASSQP